MTREPVRLFGYPITALLVATSVLAALQSTSWRAAAIAGVASLIAGWSATEGVRGVVTPVAAPNLPQPTPPPLVTVPTTTATQGTTASGNVLLTNPANLPPPSPGNPPIT